MGIYFFFLCTQKKKYKYIGIHLIKQQLLLILIKLTTKLGLIGQKGKSGIILYYCIVTKFKSVSEIPTV